MATVHRFEDSSLIAAISFLQKTKNLQIKILARSSPISGRVFFEVTGADLDAALNLLEADVPVPVKSFLDEQRRIRRLLFATKGLTEGAA